MLLTLSYYPCLQLGSQKHVFHFTPQYIIKVMEGIPETPMTGKRLYLLIKSFIAVTL